MGVYTGTCIDHIACSKTYTVWHRCSMKYRNRQFMWIDMQLLCDLNSYYEWGAVTRWRAMANALYTQHSTHLIMSTTLSVCLKQVADVLYGCAFKCTVIALLIQACRTLSVHATGTKLYLVWGIIVQYMNISSKHEKKFYCQNLQLFLSFWPSRALTSGVVMSSKPVNMFSYQTKSHSFTCAPNYTKL